MIKRFLSICFALVLLFSFGSCKKDVEYKDNIPCSDIITEAKKAVPTDSGYEAMGQGRVEYVFGSFEYDDCSLLISVATENIDEIGIFHTTSEKKAEELCAEVEKYLDELLEEKGAFIASYAPFELEKLENAQVKVYGNYVAYAILSRDGRDLFFSDIFSLLSSRRK